MPTVKFSFCIIYAISPKTQNPKTKKNIILYSKHPKHHKLTIASKSLSSDRNRIFSTSNATTEPTPLLQLRMLPSRICHLANASLKTMFKSAMARVAVPAMILTAGTSLKSDVLHGMTLSSVNSLSVNPAPLLLFNMHLPSYTSASLHHNGYMALHLMPPSPESVQLGRKFASGVKHDPSHFKVNSKDEIFQEMTEPFSGFDRYTFHETKDGVLVPVLNELEVAFICRKKTHFEVDDHEIWVVCVETIVYPNQSHQRPSGGILYFDRGFHSIGKSLCE